MSSQPRPSIYSRPLGCNNTTGAIGEGLGSSHVPRGARARPVNIPERRLWSHGRPKFYIHDSSGSSQGGSSTKSSGDGSTTSEGREGRHVHSAVSPYGSFFVEDMEIDSSSPVDRHPPNSRGSGGRTARGTTAGLNRVTNQTSARRPPSGHYDPGQSPMAPGLFETTDATYFGMPAGALPAPLGRNAPKEGGATPSTLTTSTYQPQSNRLASWSREYRTRSNSPHSSQIRPPQVAMGTALPPGSTLSNPDRQRPRSRGVARTTWRK